MRVKIGDVVYDSENIPIMVILSSYDKENISNMSPESLKYCSFPEDSSSDEIEDWMKVDIENPCPCGTQRCYPEHCDALSAYYKSRRA